jgi:hypothetical protein
MDNIPTQHNPPFWTVTTFTELTSQFKGKHAKAVACSKAKGTLLLGDPMASTINIPKLFPVPMPWWSFFLTKTRTVTEAHNWIMATTRSWNSDTKTKTASIIACQWTCTSCTSDLDGLTNSAISVDMRPGPLNEKSVAWAAHSLHNYLPRPNKAPVFKTSRPWLSPART